MAVNGASTHQNGQNGVHSFSGPPRYAPAMYAIPIEQPVVTLDAKSAFQVGTLNKITFYQKHIIYDADTKVVSKTLSFFVFFRI